MINRRAAALFTTMMVVAVACGGGGATAKPPTAAPATAAPATAAPATATAAAEGCKVAVSWNNFQQPRWAAHDEPAIKATVEAGGGTYESNDANLVEEVQATNIQTFIDKGVDVLIVLAQNTTTILPSIKAANDAGIPVIAYDRLIEDPGVLYITFDNVLVGQLEAEAILAKVPPGTADAPANYVLIKGNAADPNASTFLPMGWDNAGLKAAVDAGTIKILNGPEAGTGTWPDDYGTYTDQWATQKAQDNMEAIIDKAVSDDTPIDAILAENDSTALGVVAALTAKSYGFPPLSGQDGDPANLNNVALGKQYVDVWKQANELGNAAGAAALSLCSGGDMATLTLEDGLINPDVEPKAGLTATPFTTPGGITVSSFILQPTPLTADNLQLALDGGQTTKEDLCEGVDAASTTAPAACK
ncbi:MAG: substrate-binding domain-containing protein [Candidatus Limnocylindrales bacterium]